MLNRDGSPEVLRVFRYELVDPRLRRRRQLPATLLAELDSLAVEELRTRGNLIRLLLEDALKSRQKE
jgi:hypothetical protein